MASTEKKTIYTAVLVSERLPKIANENYLTISSNGFEKPRFFNGNRFESAHYEGEITHWLEKSVEDASQSTPTKKVEVTGYDIEIMAREIADSFTNSTSISTYKMCSEAIRKGLSLSKEGVNNVEEHIKEIQRIYLKHYEKTIDFKATEMISEIVKYFRSLHSKEGKEEAEWIDVDINLPSKEGKYFSYRVLVRDQYGDYDVCSYDYNLNRWTLPTHRKIMKWKYIK